MLFSQFLIYAHFLLLLSKAFANTSQYSTPNSKLFTSLIVDIAKIVDEDGTFAGVYSCVAAGEVKDFKDINFLSVEMPENQRNSLGQLLDKIQKLGEQKNHFLKMLFAFGALLSGQIGEQSPQENDHHLRIFLKAYECVAGKENAEGENYVPALVIRSDFQFWVPKLIRVQILLENQQQLSEENGSNKTNVRHQIREDFALLRSLNIEMTAMEVIEFALFVHNTLFSSYEGVISDYNLSLSKMRRFPRELALLLLAHMNIKVEQISADSKYFKIKMSERKHCIFGNFTHNLMRRMANYELIEQYFTELNSAEMIEIVQNEKKFFKEFSKNICFINRSREKNNAPGEIYAHYDDAIKIEWNIWKEIIQQLNEISETTKIKHKKRELGKYLTSEKFKKGMRIINAKFNEAQYGLALQAEKINLLYMDLELTPVAKIEEFCANLEKIRQISKESIEQYEREAPFQWNIVKKQKEIYDKFFDFFAIAAKNFGGNLPENYGRLEIDLNGANLLLDKLHKLAKKVQNDQYKESANFKSEIGKIFGGKMDEKAEKLLAQFEEPNEYHTMPYKKREEYRKEMNQKFKFYVEAQILNLLFSFAVRLEALIHGKTIEGTTNAESEEKKEAEKIQTLLAAWNSSKLPEWANKLGPTEGRRSQSLAKIGVQIHKKRHRISKGNFRLLKALNEHKFSVYETTKLLKVLYEGFDTGGYTGKFVLSFPSDNLIGQIQQENRIKRDEFVKSCNSASWEDILGCEYEILFKNVNKKFMKMMDEMGIDPRKHLDFEDEQNQKKIFAKKNPNIPQSCEAVNQLKNEEERKIALWKNVRYDLVMHFAFNPGKDIHDRTEDLLVKWKKDELDRTEYKRIDRIGSERNWKDYLPYFSKEIDKEKILDWEETYNYFSDEKNKEKLGKIMALDEKEEMVKEMVVQYYKIRKYVKDTKKAEEKLEKENQEIEKMEQLNRKKKKEKKELIRKLEVISDKIKKEAEEMEKYESENSTKQMRENLEALEKENRPKIAEIDIFFAKKAQEMTEKQKEIVSLKWSFKKQVEKILELAKNFGQMLENVKKHYEEKYAKNSA